MADKKFKKGDVVRLINNDRMENVPIGTLAVCTENSIRYSYEPEVCVKWYYTKEDADCNFVDGGYHVNRFELVNASSFENTRIKIGDIVRINDSEDDNSLYLVVMTDWDRTEERKEYNHYLRSVMCDGPENTSAGNGRNMWDILDESYLKDPTYVYVIPISGAHTWVNIGPIVSGDVKVVGNIDTLVKMLNDTGTV